jgi:hypothetical protein
LIFVIPAYTHSHMLNRFLMNYIFYSFIYNNIGSFIQGTLLDKGNTNLKGFCPYSSLSWIPEWLWDCGLYLYQAPCISWWFFNLSPASLGYTVKPAIMFLILMKVNLTIITVLCTLRKIYSYIFYDFSTCIYLFYQIYLIFVASIFSVKFINMSKKVVN